MIWKKVMILEHFGDKRTEHPSRPSSKTKGRHSEEIFDRCTPYDIDRQRSAKAHLVPADLEPKISPNYKIAPDEFLT